MPEGRASFRLGLLFSLVVLAWGGNYLFVRVGLVSAAPLWLATFRSGLGAAGAALWTAFASRSGSLDARAKRDALLLGVPNTALFLGLWFWAETTVPAGQAAVVIYTFPLWVVLLSGPVLGTRLGARAIASVVAGFGGVVLISEPWTTGGRTGSLLAFAALVGSAVSWAIATVLFQRRFTPEELRRTNPWQLLGGFSVLLMASVVLEPQPLPVPAVSLLLSVLWLGLFGTAFAYAVWFHLLARTPAATLGTYTFLVPVTALALSVAFTAEPIDALRAVGIALVLGSIYAVASAGRTPRPPG